MHLWYPITSALMFMRLESKSRQAAGYAFPFLNQVEGYYVDVPAHSHREGNLYSCLLRILR